MEYFDEFMNKIIQRKVVKSNNPFSKFQGIVLSEELEKKMSEESSNDPALI